MISYELALGLAVLAVVMQAESFSTAEIVNKQWGWWFIVPQFLAFVIFLLASTRRGGARAVRLGRGRAGAGWRLQHRVRLNEVRAVLYVRVYQAGRLLRCDRRDAVPGRLALPGLYTLAAFVSANFGQFAGDEQLLSLGAFLLKVTLLSFLSVWVRASVPRALRPTLMNLGWKVLLPMALFHSNGHDCGGECVCDHSRYVGGIIGFVIGLVGGGGGGHAHQPHKPPPAR